MLSQVCIKGATRVRKRTFGPKGGSKGDIRGDTGTWGHHAKGINFARENSKKSAALPDLLDDDIHKFCPILMFLVYVQSTKNSSAVKKWKSFCRKIFNMQHEKKIVVRRIFFRVYNHVYIVALVAGGSILSADMLTKTSRDFKKLSIYIPSLAVNFLVQKCSNIC